MHTCVSHVLVISNAELLEVLGSELKRLVDLVGLVALTQAGSALTTGLSAHGASDGGGPLACIGALGLGVLLKEVSKFLVVKWGVNTQVTYL